MSVSELIQRLQEIEDKDQDVAGRLVVDGEMILDTIITIDGLKGLLP